MDGAFVVVSPAAAVVESALSGYTCRLDGATVRVLLGQNGIVVDGAHVVFVPMTTAELDSCRCSVHLGKLEFVMPTADAADALHRALTSLASSVVESLHDWAIPSYPTVASPLIEKRDNQRGLFLCAGYVLHGDWVGEEMGCECRLMWAELRDDGYGVKIDMYNSHEVDARLHSSRSFPTGRGSYALSGHCITMWPEKARYRGGVVKTFVFAFRSAAEARFWLQMAEHFSRFNKLPANAEARAEALAMDFQERRRRHLVPSSPVMRCRVERPPERPTGLPMDDIAVRARAERERLGDEIADLLGRANNAWKFGPPVQDYTNDPDSTVALNQGTCVRNFRDLALEEDFSLSSGAGCQEDFNVESDSCASNDTLIIRGLPCRQDGCEFRSGSLSSIDFASQATAHFGNSTALGANRMFA